LRKNIASLSAIFQESVDAHRVLLGKVEECCFEPLARLTECSVQVLRNGGKILIFGNGGSAADAQHIAAELTIRFVKTRRALAALALTTDTSALTACGNDLGFQEIFARQIEALGRPGDLALGISTSGNSPNVIAGLDRARGLGLTAAALSGNGGGKLVGIADPLLIVPSCEAARVQEIHILLGHVLCAAIEERFADD